jgi:transposase
VERVLKKLGKPNELRVCYEAGPTGYALYWQLTSMGIACEVIAPLLELILEVDHQEQRASRLDGAIDRAVQSAPEQLRAIVAALQALRGVAQETAVTVATEFGSFERFERAVQAMSYTGLVPSEYSSGGKKRQGALSPQVAAMAWTAQERLHRRYWALTNKSKVSTKIVTALARELAGFAWAIGRET